LKDSGFLIRNFDIEGAEMELRHLHTFIKVCETMNFSKAADQLGYAQSTITMQIAQLEEELGVKLFDRNGKQFRRNIKGEELLRYANRLTALAAEAKANVSNTTTPNGLLRIGVIESIGTFFLPDILKAFLIRCPLVQVQVLTATTREIMEMLRHDKIDLMLTLDDMLYDPDWHCAWSRPEDIVFLCAPQHPFANETLPLERVVTENFLLTERHCNYRHTFERICAAHGLPVRSSLEIGCTNTILAYTKHNLGIAFLPVLTARTAFDEKRIASFMITDVKIQMYIQLIYRKSKWCTPAMKAFIDEMP